MEQNSGIVLVVNTTNAAINEEFARIMENHEGSISYMRLVRILGHRFGYVPIEIYKAWSPELDKFKDGLFKTYSVMGLEVQPIIVLH